MESMYLDPVGPSRVNPAVNQAKTDKKKKNRKVFILLGILVVMTLTFVLLPYRVGMTIGESMYPTLRPYHLFVMNISPYERVFPNRSDVVVFKHQGETMVKRIVGVQFDLLWLVDTSAGSEIVPQSMFKDYTDWLRRTRTKAMIKPVIIPPGHVFVVGDNVRNSTDSRDFGAIPTSEIMGKVIYTEDWETLNSLRQKV